MGRGKQLSQAEIDHVLQLKEQNFKISQIARSIERSRSVVETLLKDPLNYGVRKRSNKPADENSENVPKPSPKKVLSNGNSPLKQKKISPVKKSDAKQQSKAASKGALKKTKTAPLKAKVNKIKKDKPKKLNNKIKFKMLFTRKKSGDKKKGKILWNRYTVNIIYD